MSVKVEAVAEVKHHAAVCHGKAAVEVQETNPAFETEHEIPHIEIEMRVQSDIVTVHSFEQLYGLLLRRSKVIVHEVDFPVDAA